jgi:hypothetical protein
MQAILDTCILARHALPVQYMYMYYDSSYSTWLLLRGCTLAVLAAMQQCSYYTITSCYMYVVVLLLLASRYMYYITCYMYLEGGCFAWPQPVQQQPPEREIVTIVTRHAPRTGLQPPARRQNRDVT